MSSQPSEKAGQGKYLLKSKQRRDAESFHTSPGFESVGLWK